MPKSEKQVQGTNDYSSVSKNSMVQRGYFEDNFIKFFVEKNSRRSPLIHVGYCVRAKVINFIFKKFLKEVAEQHAQIVSFGAGFDASFFRLLDCDVLHSKVTYYEIDFQEVVERKAAVIQASEALRNAVGDVHNAKHCGVYLSSDRYCLIGCNLQDLTSLEEILRRVGINFTVPTLFLAECAITYMDEKSSTALINWTALKFENGIFVTYEQVYPHDAFGIVMAEHFRSLSTPLLSLSTFSDLESQEERYKEQILDDLWVLDVSGGRCTWQVKPADDSPWPKARCSHSAVACGASSMVVAGGLGSSLVPLDDVWQLDGSTMTWHRHNVVMLPRYGHTAHFTSGCMVLVGGVNMLAVKQPGVAVINTADWTCVEYSLPVQSPRKPLMLHNHSTELCEDGTILVVGGGGNCFSFGTAFNKHLSVINIKNLVS